MKKMCPAALTLAGLFLSSLGSFAAQPAAGKMIKVAPDQDDRIPYWLYLPHSAPHKQQKLPGLVFQCGIAHRHLKLHL